MLKWTAFRKYIGGVLRFEAMYIEQFSKKKLNYIYKQLQF